MTKINRDEWLKALTAAGFANPDEDDQDAVTIREFALMMKIADYTAGTHLRGLVKAGKATRTQKWAMNSHGRRIVYVAYRLVK